MTNSDDIIVTGNVLLYLWLRALVALGAIEYGAGEHAGLRAEWCIWRGRIYLLGVEHGPPR